MARRPNAMVLQGSKPLDPMREQDPALGWRGGAWGFPPQPLQMPNERQVWSGVRTVWLLSAGVVAILIALGWIYLWLQ